MKELKYKTKERLVIPKIFTRDFPIAVCQIWARTYKLAFNAGDIVFPRLVFVFREGLVNVYRHPELISRINTVILERIKINPNYLKDLMTGWNKRIGELEEAAEKEISSIEELEAAAEFIVEYWQAMYVSIYIPADERFSKAERDTAEEFRKKTDKLEYAVIQKIPEALKVIFADLSDLSKYIFLDELSNLPSKEVLIDRSGKPVILIDDNVSSEEELVMLMQRYGFELEADVTETDITEIKGDIACKGKVTGKVRLILKNEDIPELKEGEILVTYMTIPTFLPAMAKAAAFVTDEGGLLCHAAIVAREMKKPCIIGTKLATKVLKDGDEVEVDADTGVVRILKESK